MTEHNKTYLGRLVRMLWREDWYTASHRGMISRSRCVGKLLCGARWIRPEIIIGWRTLRGRRLCPGCWIAAWGIVLPHVDTSLRRTGKFSDVVDGVVGPGVRMLVTLLANKFTF